MEPEGLPLNGKLDIENFRCDHASTGWFGDGVAAMSAAFCFW